MRLHLQKTCWTVIKFQSVSHEQNSWIKPWKVPKSQGVFGNSFPNHTFSNLLPQNPTAPHPAPNANTQLVAHSWADFCKHGGIRQNTCYPVVFKWSGGVSLQGWDQKSTEFSLGCVTHLFCSTIRPVEIGNGIGRFRTVCCAKVVKLSEFLSVLLVCLLLPNPPPKRTWGRLVISSPRAHMYR